MSLLGVLGSEKNTSASVGAARANLEADTLLRDQRGRHETVQYQLKSKITFNRESKLLHSPMHKYTFLQTLKTEYERV